MLRVPHTLNQKRHTADFVPTYIPSGGPATSFFPPKKDEGSHLVVMNCDVLVGFKVAHDRTGENLPMFNWPTAQGLLIRNLQSQNKDTAIKIQHMKDHFGDFSQDRKEMRGSHIWSELEY